jgi:5-methylcytosine-specific restriction endonuclease McrA
MPLLNAFIDSIVCVGFNSERGIITDRETSDDNVIPLLSYLKPYVLGILTADQAVYPESNGTYTIDSSYPFIQHSRSSSGYAANPQFQKKQVIPNKFDTLPLFCSPDGVKISLIEESRIHHIVFTQEEGKRSYAVVLAFSQKFILKNYDSNKDGPYQIESMARNATKPSQSKKMPSAYRHNVNANPIGNMQSYSSPNATRRRLNSTSSTTETSGTR